MPFAVAPVSPARPVPPRLPRKARTGDVEQFNAARYELHDGEVVKFMIGKCFPSLVQDMFAESLVKLLNASIGHDGAWRVVWRDPVREKWDSAAMLFRPWMPTVLQCQFFDKDGDIWAAVNIEEDIHDMIETGISHWVDQCEEAYQFVYFGRHQVLDLREGVDTKAVGRGEKLTPIDDGYVPPQTGI